MDVIKEFNKNKNNHLAFSVALDILGMTTYMIPILGEFGDIIFAPFYGLAIFIMYRKRIFSSAAGGVIGTIEELLPGTDIIPTATAMWIYTYIINNDKTMNNFMKEKNKEIKMTKGFKILD